ncbi:hypothetical protein SAMN05878426_1252 [Phaeovulum vinaykumarii]|uniref:Uncharacterized protein n=1 Tax=Phaeovulum vinaykumarii TaxID=407234 RepID=A0A1N7N632_9RHOB|nr:hypothetical protein SAMN05421795_1233 [Phaeovulum vinaykumarii]SOC20370.1 hypothetical protein SAMN05878426_1252 [Phaeovulum vinaykumarii]
MNLDSEGLGYLNTDPDVLVARNDKRITNDTVAGEIDQIRHNQRIYTFLLALTVDHAEPQFRQSRVGDLDLLGVWPTATKQAVVPVGAEHAAFRAGFLRYLAQSCEYLFYVEFDGRPRLLLASNQRGTLRVDVPGINKNGDLQHALDP